jgi:hypothetical protein
MYLGTAERAVSPSRKTPTISAIIAITLRFMALLLYDFHFDFSLRSLSVSFNPLSHERIFPNYL